MWVTVNFLVCVLCLQALVVPPSVELSALFLASGIRWSSDSHTGTITPIDDGKGRILKVSVTLTHGHRHLLFSFKSLFIRRNVNWACTCLAVPCFSVTLLRHSFAGAAVICWRVSGWRTTKSERNNQPPFLQLETSNESTSFWHQTLKFPSHSAWMHVYVHTHYMERQYRWSVDEGWMNVTMLPWTLQVNICHLLWEMCCFLIRS